MLRSTQQDRNGQSERSLFEFTDKQLAFTADIITTTASTRDAIVHGVGKDDRRPNTTGRLQVRVGIG